MATGPMRGQDLQFTIHDGTAVRDISLFVRNVSGLPFSDAPVIDKTAAGAADRTYLKGIMAHTFTVSGVADNTALTGPVIAFPLIADDIVTRAFVYGPKGTGTGDPKFSGSCWVTSFTITEDYDGIALWSASCTVDGAVTSGAY